VCSSDLCPPVGGNLAQVLRHRDAIGWRLRFVLV